MSLIRLAVCSLLLLVPAIAGAQGGRGEEAEANREAEASQPPLRTLRGGTLGVANLSPDAAAGLASISVGGNEAPDLSAYADVGRLPLSEHLSISILGEMLRVDVPAAEVSLREEARPLAAMRRQAVGSIGARLLVHPSRINSDGVYESRVNDCIRRRRNRADGQSAADVDRTAEPTCSTMGIDLGVADNAVAREAAWEAADRWRSEGLGLLFGARLLYATGEGGSQLETGSGGVAGEAGLSGTIESVFRAFVSLSYVFIAERRHDTENVRDVTLDVHEISALVSGEFVLNWRVEGTQIAPRLGAYFRYSQNFWDNQFAMDEQETFVFGQRFEGGFYVAGHFSGGFSGLISFGVGVPYGARHFDDVAFVVTISPMVGSAL